MASIGQNLQPFTDKKKSKEVNKQDSDVRFIPFLSYPAQDYLNYHIDSDICKDEAALLIWNLEQGEWLVKTDWKNAIIQLTMYTLVTLSS